MGQGKAAERELDADNSLLVLVKKEGLAFANGMLVFTAKRTSDERRQGDTIKQHEGYTGLKAPFGVQAVDGSIRQYV